MSDIKHYYATYWQESGFLPTGEPCPAFEAVAEPLIVRGAKVLEVGCGDGGTNAPWLLRRGASYKGADISPPAIETAERAGLDVDLIEDAAALPYADASFDAIVCTEVLEHLFEPQCAVAEMHRVLRPNGALALSVPNSAYWRRRADLALLGRWNPLGDDRSVSEPWRDPHIRFYTAAALRNLLERHGFAVRRVGGHGGSLTAELPVVRRFTRTWGHPRADWRSHPAYEPLQERFPGLFGYRLHALARRAA